MPHDGVPQLTEDVDPWGTIFLFHYVAAGFLVKADSEGNKGPIGYNRTEADGANLLARALPDGGVVMWRAFVYGNGPFIGRQLGYWLACSAFCSMRKSVRFVIVVAADACKVSVKLDVFWNRESWAGRSCTPGG